MTQSQDQSKPEFSDAHSFKSGNCKAQMTFTLIEQLSEWCDQCGKLARIYCDECPTCLRHQNGTATYGDFLDGDEHRWAGTTPKIRHCESINYGGSCDICGEGDAYKGYVVNGIMACEDVDCIEVLRRYVGDRVGYVGHYDDHCCECPDK